MEAVIENGREAFKKGHPVRVADRMVELGFLTDRERGWRRIGWFNARDRFDYKPGMLQPREDPKNGPDA